MNYSIVPLETRPFDVDVFVPSLSLALEYNGEYHYKFVPMYPRDDFLYSFFIHYSPLVAGRDVKKKLACTQLGIHLISIPYWWDGELSSLATTIHHARPDIDVPNWLIGTQIAEVPTKQQTRSL